MKVLQTLPNDYTEKNKLLESRKQIKIMQLIIVFFLIIGIISYIFIFNNIFKDYSLKWYFQVLIGIPLYIITLWIHEFIHAFFFKIGNKGKVSFKIKSYALQTVLDKTYISRNHVIIAISAPCIILTILYIVLLLMKLPIAPALYFICILQFFGCLSDFFVLFTFLIHQNKKSYILTTPDAIISYEKK